MKNLIKIFSLAAILGFFAASCNTDPCKDVVCGTFGTCSEGTCICDAGYEQDTAGVCNTLMREKFLNTGGSGVFTAVETCDTTVYAPYPVAITQSGSSITKFNIANLYLNNTLISCDVNTTNGTSFTIASQTTPSQNGNLTVVGSGSINTVTRVISVSYTFSDANGNSQTCSAVLTPN